MSDIAGMNPDIATHSQLVRKIMDLERDLKFSAERNQKLDTENDVLVIKRARLQQAAEKVLEAYDSEQWWSDNEQSIAVLDAAIESLRAEVKR